MKTSRWIVLVAAIVLLGCAGVTKYWRPSAEAKESYITAHPETQPEFAQAIRESKWAIGMSTEQVLASLNHPYSTSSHTTESVVFETWEYKNVVSYRSVFLNFENGLLVSWSEI